MNDAVLRFQGPDAPGRWASAVLAVGMHLLLAGLLIYGVRWQIKPPEPVEVELVRMLPEPVVHTPPAEPIPEPPLQAEPATPPKPVVTGPRPGWIPAGRSETTPWSRSDTICRAR